MSHDNETPAYTAAEIRATIENLGLSLEWIAKKLGLESARHLRTIDAGNAPVSRRLAQLIHELETEHTQHVDEMIPPAETSGVVWVPRIDRADDAFPASWWRSVAMNVRRETGATLDYY